MNETGGPRLRIVAVNDVYTLEHLPRLRTLVERAASVDPPDALLVTLAGDFLSPSVLSSLDSGRAMVDCMNAVGFTHVIFGNHEDDIDTGELRARVRELEAMCLGTNVRGFDPELPRSDVIEVRSRPPGGRSVRVGLVGVVMTDATIYRRPPFGGAGLLPANEAATSEALRLIREAGCSSVVALTHQTAADDRALARAQRDPPFPVLLAGHEHQPLVVLEGGTWIVKAGSDAVQAAVIDLEWPAEPPSGGRRDLPVVRLALEDVALYAEDPALRSRVDAHMVRVTKLESATLMVLVPGRELSSVGTRSRQTTLGTLLASRVRDALGAEVCLFNGGGIRGRRTYAEHFSYGDLQAEVPFENEIVVVKLPGRVLSDAIHASRSLAPAESGGFLQVCDAVVIDPDTGVLERIQGEPLDPVRDYRVALVRNLFEGMDHVEPLVEFARTHPERIPPPGDGRDVKLVLLESFAAGLWRELGGFEAVDEDHDSRVTSSELERAITRYTKDPPSDVAAGIVLGVLDTDHDHLISPEEADAVDHPRKR